MEQLRAHVQQLRDDFRDLAPNEADYLHGPLSPVEAARMIAKNQPVVITGCTPCISSGAQLDWGKPATYTDRCERPVTIAITDDGLADSVRLDANGRATFVKPLEEKMPMAEFLRRLGGYQRECAWDAETEGDPNEKEVLYLQSQDGNLFRTSVRPDGEELAAFRQFFQRDIPWMQAATGCTAEAVNLWIGSSRARTSIHHDPYENIYHVLSGSKTFLLVAPIEGLWLDQRFYPPSTLRRTPTGLEPNLDPPPAYDVPWVASHQIPRDVQSIEVTIHEGETLYLPNGWWHAVSQSERTGGLAVAINYWYPAEIRPENYAYERLARRIARMGGMECVIPPPSDFEQD